MGDCQNPEKINDNPFSCHTIPNMTDVKVIIDENVEIQKECDYGPDGNDFILTDNFLVDLLSRDSVADVKEKVLISVENKEHSNNALISNLVRSDDKHEIIPDECNSRTTLEPGIQKSVGETISSESVNTKVLNVLQKNMTVENELGNSIFSNATCVSSDLEHGTGVRKTVEEDMEPSVDIVERSCIVKDVREIDCEIPGQENSQATDLTDSLKKSEDETVKEISIQETPKSKVNCEIDCEIPGQENSQTSDLTDSLKKSEDETVKEISIQEAPKSNIGEEQSIEGVLMVSDFNQSKYRCESDIWTDDDGSSTSDSSSSDSSSSDFFQEMCEKSKPKKMPFVKTKGELSLDELPLIEDLVISVNESEMTAIGKIYAVVETLVIIRSMKGLKALDLDSVLFLSHDQPLGRVFDVFGPVNEPFYSVRFNTVEKINEKGVKVGVDVFFAPEKSDITTYVFLEELQNQKGSDASWKHNNEPPEEFLDYSDDEKEKNAKRQRRFKNRNRQFSDNPDAPAKRSLLAEDSSNYIPPPKPAPQWNRSQNIPYRFARPNPFQSHVPSPSPSPTVHSFMSPVRVQNSFGSSPNQPQRVVQPQNIMYRPSPHVFVSPYQQPHHVFGQLTVLNHLSPAFHTPPPLPSPLPPLPSPVMNNIPTLVPASPFTAPQNYFNQTFTRSPSPVTHNQHMSPDPWLSNRPYNSTNVPPSHPLTVQIPNMGSPSLPMHQFPGDRGSVQQFVNIQNGNYEPFVNNRNFSNFPPVNVQPRFYQS